MTQTTNLRKTSPAQRDAIAAAADENHDADAAALIVFGRLELHAGLDDRVFDAHRD